VPKMDAVKISNCVDCAFEPSRGQRRVRGEHEAVGQSVLPILRLRPSRPRRRSLRKLPLRPDRVKRVKGLISGLEER
jgi:hypothetical protein